MKPHVAPNHGFAMPVDLGRIRRFRLSRVNLEEITVRKSIVPWLLGFCTILSPAAPAWPGAAGLILSGIVRDGRTAQPVPDVNIIIEGTRLGTVTHENGWFILKNVPPGTHTLQAGVLGYRTEILRITATLDTVLDIAVAPRPVPLNPVVVTATRSSHLYSAVSAACDILPRERLDESNGNTAAEALAEVGSLLVKDNGGFAGLKTLSIRGSSDAQVLVLLDGQRLNTAQSGGVDLGGIPLEALERIEIVRGGHSALLGTDAVGGAVHLITRAPRPDRTWAFGTSGTVGSFGTLEWSAHGSLAIGPVKTFVFANQLRSAGDFVYRPPGESTARRRENNGIESRSILLKTGVSSVRLGDCQVLVQSFTSDRGAADPVFFSSASGRRHETRTLGSISWNRMLSRTLRADVQTRLQHYDNRFESLFENDMHRNRSMVAEAHLRWARSSQSMLQTGLEWSNDRLQSSKLNRRVRSTRSAYAEWEAIVAGRSLQWKWTPALRWDDFGREGTQACPKIGMLVRAERSDAWSVRANFGRSFRMPTFNDLFWPDLVWPGYGGTRGNPFLRPETGRNADIGFSARKTGSVVFEAECFYFRNDFHDLIQWESDADFIFSPVNIGQARITGLESRLTFRSTDNRWNLEWSPAWMRAVDLIAPRQNRRLVYHPDWKWTAAAGFPLPHSQGHLSVQYVGRRFAQPGNQMALPGYWFLGGTLRTQWDLPPLRIGMKMQILNALDRSVSAIDGYPLPGREIRFSISVQQ